MPCSSIGFCSLLLLATLWTTLIAGDNTTTFVPPTTLNVGVVSDLTTGSVWTFAIVFDDLNNDTSILPNTKLTYTYTEAGIVSKPDPASIVPKMRKILAANPVAVVGCRYSDDSKQIAYETAPDKIPQISWGSSATDFSDKNAFPYFSRTYPDVGKEMQQLAAFLIFNKWYKVAVFYSTDTTGASLFNSFSKVAKQRNIKVIVSSIVSDSSATASDLEYPIGILAASNARIFLDLSNYATIHPQLLLTQEKFGLRQPGYVWIGSHASMLPFSTTSFPNGTANPAMQGKLDGHINIRSQQVDDRPLYKILRQKIIDYPDTPELLAMQTLPYTRTNTWNWAQTQAQQYDAVKLLALALHELIEVQKIDPMSPAGRVLLNTQIRKGKFIGLSGEISLDSNGDVLVPFQTEQIMPATGYNYTGAGSFTLDPVTGFYTYAQFPGKDFYWKGGIVPVDTTQRLIYQNSQTVRDAMIVTAAVLMALLLVAHAMLYAKRKTAMVKATSHVYTQLSLLGATVITSSVIARMMIQNTSDAKTIDGANPDLNEMGQLNNEDISWQKDAKNVAAAEMYLINLGYYLLVGSLLVKTWRISRIFNMRKIKTVKGTGDHHLLFVLFALMLCELAVMIGLHYGDEFQFSLNYYNDTTDIHQLTREHGPNAVSFPVIYIFRFLILVPTCIFTFKVRNIPSAFNESIQLLVTVYNLAFMSILLPIIESTVKVSTDPALIAHGVAVFFIVTTTAASLVVPKLYGIYTKQSDGSSLHTTNKSTAGSSDTEGKRAVTDGSSNNVTGATGSGVTRGGGTVSPTNGSKRTNNSLPRGPSNASAASGTGQNLSYIPKPSPKREQRIHGAGGSNVSQIGTVNTSQIGVEMGSVNTNNTAQPNEISPQPSPSPKAAAGAVQHAFPSSPSATSRAQEVSPVMIDIDNGEVVTSGVKASMSHSPIDHPSENSATSLSMPNDEAASSPQAMPAATPVAADE